MSATGKKRAMVIALSDYDDKSLPQLGFCKNDGKGMYETLTELKYEITSDCSIVGKGSWNKIRDAIIDFFKNKEIRPDDTLFFYYSGHGVPDGFGNHFLAPSDIDCNDPERRGIPFDFISEEMKKTRASKVVVVLDCCFSGAVENAKADEEAKAKEGRDAMDSKFQEGDGRCILASSLAHQSSYNMPNKDTPFSAFTYFLIEGLKGGNGQSVDINGYVTPDTLGDYTFGKLMSLGGNMQKPIRKTTMSGNIILAKYQKKNPEIKVVANNDIAFVTWKYPAKIPDCLGFTIYRSEHGTRMKVPSNIQFTREFFAEWKPIAQERWPIQSFYWSDLTAEQGGSYQYRIIPVVGKPNENPQPKNDLALTSEEVNIISKQGIISAYFNRGILSTQSLAQQIPKGPSGNPDYVELRKRISQPGDPIRENLAGEIRIALKSLLERARTQGGHCYGALYELADAELLAELLSCSSFVHLILSNTGLDDNENLPARQALHEANVDIIDRMLPLGHIGHNKFIVYLDRNNTPRAVLTGGTNWTPAGMCAQTNNAIIIESPVIASFYFDYWNRLKKDTQEGGNKPQTSVFRNNNNKPYESTLDDGKTKITVWFSPNTKTYVKTLRSHIPSDMSEVFDIMTNAKQAILFLVFQTGKESIISQSAICKNKKPDLFIRGVVNDPKELDLYYNNLNQTGGNKPEKILNDIVAPTAITEEISFLQKELLKISPSAHSIIHDNVVVVDPFSDDCVVISGSHNLGYRSSYNNDENLVIIRGNQEVAQSYAVHVMGVYDHYRWRFMLKQNMHGNWTDHDWQNPYFSEGGELQNELKFLTSVFK